MQSGSMEPDSGLRERVPALERWKASPLSGSESARARLRRRYLWSGYRPEPLPSHRETVEDPAGGRVGICCSGGGIRSAAFNLGALQALQDAKVLARAKYLAAVSGGSYIAAAFAMVHKASLGATADNSGAGLLLEKPPFHPGSPEEQYLRNRCNYLAPDGMAKLYLGWRVILGLLFNVVFLALPLIGATIVLGASVYQRAFPSLVKPPPSCTKVVQAASTTKPAVTEFVCHTVALPTWSWAAPATLLGLSILMGLSIMILRIRHEAKRRAAETWTTRLLIGAVLVALLTMALPELVALLHPAQGTTSAKTSSHTASTLATYTGGGVLGLLAALSAHLRSALGKVEGDAKRVGGAAAKLKALTPRLQRAFAYAVAAIVGPLLFYFVIVFAMSLTLADAGTVVHRERLLLAGAGTLALSALIYFGIDITALSLHHFYKRRLCTAFALRRVLPRPIGSPAPGPRRAEEELPRLAADADEEARGIAVERDYERLTPLSETGANGAGWPTLLVCAAANISDPGATPPGRHVTSFTFSPHSVGGPLVGAMSTKEYEKAFHDKRARARDLTLPAAVAMSGAAIAPSMGKLTRRPLTFLLALGNVRLGVWIPNPRWAAATRQLEDKRLSWIPRWQRPRASYLIRELFGRNRVDSRYLFVTDGGHYENLGLVELLRRGCTEIYCFDASGGESFSELGDAVALARSELGVEICINPSPLTPAPADSAKDGAKGSAPQTSSTTAEASGTGTGGAKKEPDDSQPEGRLERIRACLAACLSTTAPAVTAAADAPATADSLAKDEPAEPGMAADSVVRAKFTYPPAKPGDTPLEGVLYYARNVMTNKAPWDVRARHLEDPTFPHDPTTDQLYTDQKFESYRALGAQAGKRAFALAQAEAH
jgi:predicted acylesterase/phospholipase RssA